MKQPLVTVVVATVVVALVLIAAAPVHAVVPAATGYAIDWYTIDGGGARNVTSGSYALSGTIGQFDAGLESNGAYALAGGFWNAFVQAAARLFLPLVTR